ncbi:hypothetical protein HII31_05147 [Pseudocercospora fuligena]|uniref:Uncharacterized protein n=1 Tax=Pseudocercospora fuligena TaxID=685502 RepID=A0A8H6VKC3_9PEZI|nr:hypothetical protein HII31_05147 [Pseudocercospora fuligena]
MALPSQIDAEPEAEQMNIEDGEVPPAEIAATKVHIQGLAELTTQDIENFARDHYDSELFRKVEWVDDNSANLIYDTAEAAKEALQILSREQIEDPLDLRAAKALSTHPHVELFVRQAVVTDQKERESIKKRAPPRSPARKGSYHSEEDLFAGKRDGRRPRREEEDLFAGRSDGRLRNRSASPIRDGDGRYGFSDDQPYRQTARRRSPPPIRPRSHTDNYAAREKIKTELFPSKKKSTALTNGRNGNGAVELFPDRASPPAQGKNDLFPDKVNHKRQDAKDIHPDEVASAIGKFNMSLQKEYMSNDDSGRRPAPGRDLFSRIDAESTNGRLTERPSSSDNFSFKGASRKEDQGVNFLGASKDRTELFPKGGSGGGRDLFEEKEGRPQRRGRPVYDTKEDSQRLSLSLIDAHEPEQSEHDFLESEERHYTKRDERANDSTSSSKRREISSTFLVDQKEQYKQFKAATPASSRKDAMDYDFDLPPDEDPYERRKRMTMSSTKRERPSSIRDFEEEDPYERRRRLSFLDSAPARKDEFGRDDSQRERSRADARRDSPRHSKYDTSHIHPSRRSLVPDCNARPRTEKRKPKDIDSYRPAQQIDRYRPTQRDSRRGDRDMDMDYYY